MKQEPAVATTSVTDINKKRSQLEADLTAQAAANVPVVNNKKTGAGVKRPSAGLAANQSTLNFAFAAKKK